MVVAMVMVVVAVPTVTVLLLVSDTDRGVRTHRAVHGGVIHSVAAAAAVAIVRARHNGCRCPIVVRVVRRHLIVSSCVAAAGSGIL